MNRETAEPKEKNFLAKWIGIYFSPSETFASIERKPDWVLPLLITALVSIAVIFIIAPVLHDSQIQAMMDRGMSEDQAYQAMDRMSIFKYLTPVFGGIGVFIAAFVLSGIFYLVFNFFLGGESSYKKVLSVYSYTGLAVGIVGTIVRVPLVLAKGTMKVQTGLAAFLPQDMQGRFLYKLFAKFDIFTIWEIVLLIIGLSVIYKFSKGKSASGIIALWLIWIVISILLGNLIPGMA
ncbi:MAG TPA: YIP1 family protein [Bacteroidetes bacterium]|nr:YIP1 family protein [Bacteroidota bacterium]